ncbi:hypothetical protein DFH09DRAFT_1413050, partial [Mycena vulgaris]
PVEQAESPERRRTCESYPRPCDDRYHSPALRRTTRICTPAPRSIPRPEPAPVRVGPCLHSARHAQGPRRLPHRHARLPLRLHPLRRCHPHRRRRRPALCATQSMQPHSSASHHRPSFQRATPVRCALRPVYRRRERAQADNGRCKHGRSCARGLGSGRGLARAQCGEGAERVGGAGARGPAVPEICI